MQTTSALTNHTPAALGMEASEVTYKQIAIIVVGAGLDPATHRTELSADASHVVIVGVTEPSQALDVAKKMVKEGAERIELCGGFDAVWAAAVVVAIAGEVPVGILGPWSAALFGANPGTAAVPSRGGTQHLSIAD